MELFLNVLVEEHTEFYFTKKQYKQILENANCKSNSIATPFKGRFL